MKHSYRRVCATILMMVSLFVFPSMVYASESSHLDPVASVIFWVTLLFFFGVIGRYLATKMHQPSVLGEVLMGVLVGNVGYFFDIPLTEILREGSGVFHVLQHMLSGQALPEAVHASFSNPIYAQKILKALSSPQSMDFIKIAYVVDVFSRYGAILLLFMVGLEISLAELKHTGRQSFQVALIGVAAPILLGIAVSFLLIPYASMNTSLFVAATLSATSVGISARVFQEMKKMNTSEARTILGAAMIDDVLGLMILTIVSRLVLNGSVHMGLMIQVIALTLIFFGAVFILGPHVLRIIIRFCSFLTPWEAKLTVSFIFLMGLAWFATVVQLAAIVGAFAAGVIIHDDFFDVQNNKRELNIKIKELIGPLEALLAPLFFILMGIQVKLESFMDFQVLGIAIGLMIAAIVGKLLSGMGASRQQDRWLVGIGMMPRGEVGLVFASIGKTLGVISDSVFAAMVLMVIVTTVLTPLCLKRRYASKQVSAS